MSTEFLTTFVSVALIAGLFTLTIVKLYQRRLAAAAFAAAATCTTVHIVFVSLAWEGAMIACLNAPTMESVEWPPITSFPTAVYDAPAWAAVVFLTTGIVLAAIQRRRQKAAEKKLLEAVMRSFRRINEGNESEKD